MRISGPAITVTGCVYRDEIEWEMEELANEFFDSLELMELAAECFEEAAHPRVRPAKRLPNKVLLVRKERQGRVPKHVSWKDRLGTRKPWGNRPKEAA